MSQPNVKTESTVKKPARSAKKTEKPAKKTDRTVFKSKTRQVIANVYDFMKKEAIYKVATKLTDARWRTAQAAGVSETTVTRILRERREHLASASTSSAVFISPMKRRVVRPRKLNLEEIDIGAVRRTVQNYHNEYKQLPTLIRLNNVLKERAQFDSSPNTLRRLLHKLGFRWRKTVSNGKVLMENHDIKMSRLKYLRQLKTYRNEGRPVVYLNESYYILTYRSWMDSATGARQHFPKGSRIIIDHAGSAAGSIPNVLLTFRTESKPDDHSDITNIDYYLKWLEEKLIPNLPKGAVLVIGNASYHNTNMVKIPTSDSSVSELQSWLEARNISYEKNFKKVELYDLVLKNKEYFQRYKADDLLHSNGFCVLRIPLNHQDLNPTESIWNIVKGHVSSRCTDHNITNIMHLINGGFKQITTDIWADACRNAEKIEDEYLQYFDMDISFMVKLCDTSDSDTNLSDYSSDD